MDEAIHGPSLLTEEDIRLLKQGNHFRLHDKLGAHVIRHDGRAGTLFSVWAPGAAGVSVIGDFNGWNPEAHQLAVRWDGSGIWEGFIPEADAGSLYKYRIKPQGAGAPFDKADPFASFFETPPGTSSKVWNLEYDWHDQAWLGQRAESDLIHSPLAVYEVHLGSWRRKNGRPLSYRELAEALPGYARELGFTHVELLPVTEHPFYGSWGYQTLGYFAPTGRYGTPQDFMFLVDRLHRAGIGVILDWTAAHFPQDPHGLARFDGTCLFEYEDPRQARHPDWDSLIFNYGRREVRAFLVSSALSWLDRYHADGLRLDAVASMLYLDYSRKPGEWTPNRYGGNENLEAVELIRALNKAAYGSHPGTQIFAEESTAWPMVSRPVDVGGLGFGFKWNMGWMNDTLGYMAEDPAHRRHHHDRLTFSTSYAWNENYILPLSHDEVVHGKASLLSRMPGDDWQKFANLRLLLAFQYCHPGKKLLFMGGEFGQRSEWNHDAELEWNLLQYAPHQGVQRLVADLNRLLREPAFHELDCEPAGFRWVDCADAASSVLCFLRLGRETGTVPDCGAPGAGDCPHSADSDCVPNPEISLVVANFTPVVRYGYEVGVPRPGTWQELLNTNSETYGGSGVGNPGAQQTSPRPRHGFDQSLALTLPPLALVVLKPKTT